MRTRLPLTVCVATGLGGLPFFFASAFGQVTDVGTGIPPAAENVPAVVSAPATPHHSRQHFRTAKRKTAAAKVHPGSATDSGITADEQNVTQGSGALPSGWQQERIGVQADGDAEGQPGKPPLRNASSSTPQSKGASSGGNTETPPPSATQATANEGHVSTPVTAQVSKIFLPTGDDAGIAAFWSRNDMIILSDHVTHMDASALRDTGPFASVAVRTMGDMTAVTFHFENRHELTLSKQPGGWILALSPDDVGKVRARITSQEKDGGILYPMSRPGRIVPFTDPSSGARLLVATSSVGFPGPRLPRRHVGYELWPSVQGLVFAVESDQIELRDGDGGPFLDVVGEGAVPLASAASGQATDDRVDWSWLGLRSLPPETLREDYRRHWTQAAMLPPDSRTDARLAAARSAFALGDAHNARAILATAIQDNPELAMLPNVAFLQAASELLAGNTAGASALESADTGADGALWRGLYMERAGKDPAGAAALLAQGYSRLTDYPATLRNRLQPEAATFIAQYGSDQDLSVLSPVPDAPAFAAVRAFMQLRAGDQAKALTAFQAMAKQKDPVIAEAGGEQSVVLRQAAGQISPVEAAQAYERLLPASRLAGREENVRRALVSSWMKAGEWEKALSAADEEMRVFPEGREAMMPQVQDILLHLAETPDSSGSHPADVIDAVALIESHIDQIPDSPVKGRILGGLGEKLRGLGLPGRAALAFERALPLADDNARRATWGGELAQVDIEAQRLGQARRALDETADTGVGGDVASRRRVIAASLMVREGNRDQALQMLAQDETDPSLDLRGRILEEQKKWPDAVLVVGRMATKDIPEQGSLNDTQQDLTVRLATDAARASDWETLDRLRDWIGRRHLSPERQRIFELLVTSPEEDIRKRLNGG